MADAIGELSEAIFALRRTFKRHGLEAPVSIDLASSDQIRRLERLAAANGQILVRPGEGRDGPVLEANICGIKIRAPAQLRPRNGSGFDVV